MNYTVPPTAPAPANPININVTDLTGSDFTKLNSTPLTICAGYPDKFIVPVFFLISYSITSLQPNSIYITGNSNLTLPNKYFTFNATDFSGTNGYITFPVVNLSLNNFATNGENITPQTSIMLSAPSDDIATQIASFKIKTYFYIVDLF